MVVISFGVDESDWWRICLAMNGCLFRVSLFTELIGFDLCKVGAPSLGRQYGRGLPVPMSTKHPGIDFRPLVDFVALVTRFFSVIVGAFPIMTCFHAHHSKIEEIAHLSNN
jgi:hypothetical protein